LIIEVKNSYPDESSLEEFVDGELDGRMRYEQQRGLGFHSLLVYSIVSLCFDADKTYSLILIFTKLVPILT
jgi:hypothetical protein